MISPSAAAPEVDLASDRLGAYISATQGDRRGDISILAPGLGTTADTAHIPLAGFFSLGDPDSLVETIEELKLAGMRQQLILATPELTPAVAGFGETRRPSVVKIDRRNELRFTGPNAMTYDAQYAGRCLLPPLGEFADGQAEFSLDSEP